jgi:polyhydroxybutyrate depolymerase
MRKIFERISRASLFVALSFVIASPIFAKNIQCVAARGRSPVKIESRCMNLQVGEATRTYRLYKPHTLAKSSVPLLLVLHGGGGSGSAMEGLTLAQFNRIADKYGAIIVYPDGVGRGWNDGRSDLHAKAVKDDIDDVGFLRALVEHLAAEQPINRSRVYATGISNGGLMSYRLACDAADLIAAVAPVAANFSVELASECRPSRTVPIAMINGTDDPIMPWIGGEIKVLWSRRGEVLSSQETFERWMKLGDCALPITHAPRNLVPDDGTSLVRHIARECKNGAEVRLYEISGGGHTWPSGSPYLTERLVGKVSRELNASEEIWSFVSRFSLP